MSEEISEKLHRMRVRLFDNYLPKLEGKYHAKTINEASLTVEDLSASSIKRGGYTGSYDDLVKAGRMILREAAYKLCDGFGINFEYFHVQPHVKGTFSKAWETQNDDLHPICFRYRTGAKLKKLTDDIEVIVEGLAGSEGYIDEFLDVEEDEANALFVPGHMFILTGNKIKVAGDDPACGVFFIPVNNPSAEVKAAHLAENTRTKIIGICPQTGYQHNRICVRTKYAGSPTVYLKTIRVITSSFVIEEA